MNEHRDETAPGRRLVVLSLLVILCVAAFVRIYRLDHQSFWLDEAYSACKSDQTVSEIIGTFYKDDSNPPTYLVIINWWRHVFGRSDFSMRLSSCAFGVLSILMAYFVVREIAGNKAGLAVAGLMAVSPYHVWYSQELRMYALLTAAALAALFCLIRAAKTGRSYYWTAYAILAAFAFYVHLAAAITILCFNLWLLLNRKRFKIGFSWILATVIVVAVCAPWGFVIQHQQQNDQGSRFDINQSINPAHAAYVYYEFYFGRSTGPSIEELKANKTLSAFQPHIPLIAAYAVVFAAASIMGGINFFKKRGNPTLFACMVIAPVILLALLALATPLPLHSRNIIPALPFFLLLPAWGLLGKGPAWARGVLAALIVALSCYAIYNYHFDERHFRDDYRSATKFIKENVDWNQDVVFVIDNHKGFGYSGIETGKIKFIHSRDELFKDYLRWAATGKRRAWLVSISPEIYDPKYRILQYMKDHYPEITGRERSYPGINIRCFDVEQPKEETQE